MPAPVAVGYDGSPQSQRAIDWAVDEARHRNRPLLVVSVHLTLGAPPPPEPGHPDPSAERQAVHDMLDTATRRIAASAPDLDVNCELISALTSGAGLVRKSGEWALLVMGDRGRGGFAGMLLGSTTTQVSAHADCPVIVVRDTEILTGPNTGRVVIGVDGSPSSRAAVRFGLHEAQLRSLPVTVVHAWHYPAVTLDAEFASHDAGDVAARATRVLTESLAGIRTEYPDVPLKRLSIHGSAREVLLDQSVGAGLLVVGSRGYGGFRGLLLGSTSQAVLHHAEAPVAIVRAAIA